MKKPKSRESIDRAPASGDTIAAAPLAAANKIGWILSVARAGQACKVMGCILCPSPSPLTPASVAALLSYFALTTASPVVSTVTCLRAGQGYGGTPVVAAPRGRNRLYVRHVLVGDGGQGDERCSSGGAFLSTRLDPQGASGIWVRSSIVSLALV